MEFYVSYEKAFNVFTSNGANDIIISVFLMFQG